MKRTRRVHRFGWVLIGLLLLGWGTPTPAAEGEYDLATVMEAAAANHPRVAAAEAAARQGAAALGEAKAAARPRLAVPPLPLHEWRLANGLRVIALPDPAAAT
ncbi:MAG: hypothetical protein QHJ73_12955, partial [Armatimonadota bacterium]|nr:hypothetical protein [Armatimonadota bacterium]